MTHVGQHPELSYSKDFCRKKNAFIKYYKIQGKWWFPTKSYLQGRRISAMCRWCACTLSVDKVYNSIFYIDSTEIKKVGFIWLSYPSAWWEIVLRTGYLSFSDYKARRASGTNLVVTLHWVWQSLTILWKINRTHFKIKVIEAKIFKQ